MSHTSARATLSGTVEGSACNISCSGSWMLFMNLSDPSSAKRVTLSLMCGLENLSINVVW